MKSIRFLSLLLLLNLFAAGGYAADHPVKKRDCRKWCELHPQKLDIKL